MITVVMEPGMKDKSRWTASLGGKLAGKMWIDASGDDPAEVYAKEIRQRLLKSMNGNTRLRVLVSFRSTPVIHRPSMS